MYYNYSDLNYINEELAIVWPGWTAVKLLGKGSFGAVYEIHRSVRFNVEKAAVKVLRVPDNDAEIARLQLLGMNPKSTDSYYENMVDGIYNEIQIMQRFVGNSHIVSYEDYAIRKRYNEVGWDIYIRMELLTGLSDYMRSLSMSDQITIKLGMDIAQGLRDCHNAGIIHRDIKPENIFVNKAGNFKLGDFGVSRNAPGSQDVLSFKGTLGYMAPEVYKMQATDARSDIYSLGVVLYQCLNDNRLPFVPEDFTPYDIETARQLRLAGEPIPEPAHGSWGLKKLVLKALEERPEDRFQTAEKMYLALQGIYRVDYIDIAASYQNTAQPAINQKDTAEHYYGESIESNNTDAVSQEIVFHNQHLQGQYTQYQPAKSNPFPQIHVAVAVGMVAVLIAVAGIGMLLAGRSHTPGSGQVMQIQESEQIVQMSQSAEDQSAEEPLGDDVGMVEEQTDELAGEEFADYAIDWKDHALEVKMRELTDIGVSAGDIMYSDVKDITSLYLWDNQIRDISALSNLPNLKYLNLGSNQITDISALSNLTQLQKLDLSYNYISDISALSGLTNLTELNLRNNQISDFSPIKDLHIKHLYK